MPKLSEADKQKIREKNYANILKKLQQGKTLTKYENELLEEMGEEPQKDERTHQGRRRVFGEKGNRCFMSMKAAAGALDISVETIKRIKAQGCDAFHGSGRVYEKPLLEWIRQHGTETKPRGELDLKDQKIAEEVRRLRNRNAEDEERLIAVDQVQEELTKALASQRSILTRRLLNEYPARVSGLSPEQCRVYSKRLIDEVCKELQNLAEGYGNQDS